LQAGGKQAAFDLKACSLKLLKCLFQRCHPAFCRRHECIGALLLVQYRNGPCKRFLRCRLIPMVNARHGGKDAGAFLLNAADAIDPYGGERAWGEPGCQVPQEKIAEGELEDVYFPVCGGQRFNRRLSCRNCRN